MKEVLFSNLGGAHEIFTGIKPADPNEELARLHLEHASLCRSIDLSAALLLQISKTLKKISFVIRETINTGTGCNVAPFKNVYHDDRRVGLPYQNKNCRQYFMEKLAFHSLRNLVSAN